MVIRQRVFSNVGFGDNIRFGKVPLSIRSCIFYLRQKQLSVLWPDLW